MDKARLKCRQCGAPVGAKKSRCPNGHKVNGVGPSVPTPPAAIDDTLNLSSLKLSTETPSSAPKKVHLNTLYECWKCNRLVETQNHQDKMIVPRFCPWCGKQVSSIIGREIDGYRIDEVISRGGFGIIYLASNIAQPAMKAAVKFLRPEMIYLRPELIKIFIEEARLTEAIGQTCWNIVRLSNVREKPWPYFFMEYIRGSTVESYIEASWPKRIPMRDCIGYLRGIAKALAVTHGHGRIHRDLKPLNIMVIKSQEIPQPEEKIKLLDFGLAMKIAGRRDGGHSELGASGMTTSGSFDSPLQSAGTPEYMPPEAFDGINEFGGDLYSFGVTAYEILTGERPWKDPSMDTQRFSYWRDCHKKKPPRPIRELRPEIPKWLARVVIQCLEKDPKKRIPDSTQLLKRLREPMSRWVKLGAAAAALVFVALGVYAFRPRESNETVTWKGDSLLESPPVLYVSSEADLPGRYVTLRLTSMGSESKKILECSADSPDSVKCELLEADLVRLKFLKPDPALLERTLTVRGSGKGFVFRDAIRIEVDRDPPKVGELQYLADSGAPLPVKPGQRFRPGEAHQFKVEITDPHFSSARLWLQNPDQKKKYPVDESSPKKGVCTWRVPEVADGRWQIWVEAVDLAGNTNERERQVIDCFIDKTLYFTRNTRPNQFLIARKNLVYEFKIDGSPRDMPEKIAKIEVLDEGGKEVPYQIFENKSGENASAIGLIDILQEKNRISLGDLNPDSANPYLLGIPLGEGRGFSFEVRVADASLPTSFSSFKLSGDCPTAIQPSDVTAIELNGVTGSPTDLYRRIGASLNHVDVRVTKNTVLHANCWIGGQKESRPLAVTPEQVSLADVPGLSENQDFELVLALYDPMEIELKRKYTIHVDTLPPRFKSIFSISESPGKQIDLASTTKEFHRVKSGAEIRLRLESDEDLLKAEVLKGRGDSFATGKPAPGRPREIEIPSLDELHLQNDGSYELLIKLTDLVGNVNPQKAVLNIDSSAPVIRISPAVADNYPTVNDSLLLKNQDQFVLEASDGNGIDEARARFKIVFSSGGELEPEYSASGDQPNTRQFRISLKALPEMFDGQIVADVHDKLGVPGQRSWKIHFELDKNWADEVDWKGLKWVHFKEKKFYISKTEVSNALFCKSSFIKDGKYLDEKLKNYEKPRYWGKGDEFPRYLAPGAPPKEVAGDRFPIVGVPPEVAEGFARSVFGEGVRLPTREEWNQVAHIDNPARYPWGEDRRGISWFNYLGCWHKRNSTFESHYYVAMINAENGKRMDLGTGPVEVDFPPFPKNLEGKADFARVWHLLGNVGEFVWHKDLQKYEIAGGDFSTPVEKTGIDFVSYTEDNPNTGFRLVIELTDKAPGEFLKKASVPREGGK